MSKPAHKLRFANLQVTIWRNVNREKGNVFYSVNPVRSYKEGDETWKETSSLSPDDALIMAELLRQAFAWVAKQMQAEYTSRKAKEQANSDAE